MTQLERAVKTSFRIDFYLRQRGHAEKSTQGSEADNRYAFCGMEDICAPEVHHLRSREDMGGKYI
jgi:hypothetical protein